MRGRILWGLALVVLGIFFLVYQLGWLGTTQFPFMMFPFGFLALLFLLTFIGNPRQWWAAIPGCILLGLTLLIFNDQNHFLTDAQAGALFLFSIGLPFLLVYLIDRRMWWALIPGGVLSTVALIALLAEREASAQVITAVIFFGLALVFALVRLATRSSPWMGWATWVAIILAGIGAVVLITGPQAASLVGPVVLIGLGLFLLGRSLLGRSRSR